MHLWRPRDSCLDCKAAELQLFEALAIPKCDESGGKAPALQTRCSLPHCFYTSTNLSTEPLLNSSAFFPLRLGDAGVQLASKAGRRISGHVRVCVFFRWSSLRGSFPAKRGRRNP